MNSICALVTLYHPTDEVVENMKILSQQVNHVFVIDNTPNESFENMFSMIENITYKANLENFGLSKAFNILLKNENIKEYDYIIFFDQDSRIDDEFIHKLIEEFMLVSNKLNSNQIFIGPAYFNRNTNVLKIPKDKKEIENGIFKVKSIITSGLLTTYECLKSINFWNEKIFLDLAELELCWRFISIGGYVCLSSNIVLQHSLGYGNLRIGKKHIAKSIPVREYYQTRECLKLLFKSYTPLRFRLIFLYRIFFSPIIRLIYYDYKKQRIKYYFLGILDFFRGKNGVFQ